MNYNPTEIEVLRFHPDRPFSERTYARFENIYRKILYIYRVCRISHDLRMVKAVAIAVINTSRSLSRRSNGDARDNFRYGDKRTEKTQLRVEGNYEK